MSAIYAIKKVPANWTKNNFFLGVCFMALLLPRLGAGMEENRNAALQLYQEGLFQETGTGDLKMAIKIYTTLIEKYKKYQDVTAVALYHLGLAHEKLGDYPAAKKHFKAITRNYRQQVNLVRQAKIKLRQLAKNPPKKKKSKKQLELLIPDTSRQQTSVRSVKSSPPAASALQTATWGIGLNYLGGHVRCRTPDHIQIEIKAQSRGEDILLGVRGAFVSPPLTRTMPLVWYIGMEYDYVINETVDSKYITGGYIGGEISLTKHLGWGGDIGYYYLNAQTDSRRIIVVETAANIYLTWYF